MPRTRWGRDWRPLDHDPEALASARRAAGFSQRTLGIAVQKSRSYICEIEAGTRNAHPALLLKIAEVIHCPYEVLAAKRLKRAS